MTIRSASDLERKVLEYHPNLREHFEQRPEDRSELEQIAGEEYPRYSPFIGGASAAASKTGHGLGYVGDIVFFASAIAAASNPLLAPYMLTGLLLKKGNLAAQIPDAVKSIRYIAKTGDVVGGVRNIGAKVASYIPGATILDRGLSDIAERRAVSRVAYRINEKLGLEHESWHKKVYESLKESGKYTDVKDRRENIVRPNIKLHTEDLEEVA